MDNNYSDWELADNHFNELEETCEAELLPGNDPDKEEADFDIPIDSDVI